MCAILLVEDHKIMAESLARVLEARGNVKVAEVAGSAEEAMRWLSGPQAEHQVDLVLVDVDLPCTNGIELVSMIRQKYPGLPCLMISSWNSEQYIQGSLVAGARGYILKDDVFEVIDGIRHVLEGGTYLSKRIVEGAN